MIREKQNQKVDFSVMSSRKCKECGMPLKQNVVSRNPNAIHCYVCFKLSKGKKITTIHRMINGEKVEVKKIDFRKLQLENRKKYLN